MLSYGYALDRSQTQWTKRGVQEIVRGVLVIQPEQALRIHRLYATGMSPKAIARLLNAEAVPGARGRVWRASTIQGDAKTGVGILNNELYIGRLVHGQVIPYQPRDWSAWQDDPERRIRADDHRGAASPHRR